MRRSSFSSCAGARRAIPSSRRGRIRPISARLNERDDHDVTNAFSALGHLKPGWFRLSIVIFVLWLLNFAARHIYNRGRLARVGTIHFARWVFLDDRRRLLFCSNYDGSLESYMDDFINKAGFGLNLVFSNGIGYPRTRFLIFGGAKEEQQFKNFLRRHQLPTDVWYKAYPGLTAFDLARNSQYPRGPGAQGDDRRRGPAMARTDLGPLMPQPVTEHDDIQGLVRAGYGSLKEAIYLLLRIRDRAAAKAWLASAPVTSVADMRSHLKEARHLAFTAAGLRALGVGESIVEAFSPEFVSGMAGEDARSRRLGDIAANAPSHWEWGSGAGEPHILLMLYAESGRLAALRDSILTPAFTATFEVRELATSNMGGREPFGFADGISQPRMDWDGERDASTSADLEYGNVIAPGEFLLGYLNEYVRYTDRPLLNPALVGAGDLPFAPEDAGRRDLGRNGTYLVFRQLHQDVRGFWRFIASQSARVEPARLAEAMVGRTISGDPLVPLLDRPIRGVGPDATDIARNRFTYESDGDGVKCPLGGHVRRANPRTGDMPGGVQNVFSQVLRQLGLKKDDPRADLAASSRFHRILRRGREYGRFIEPEAALKPDEPDPESGINFICLNANIARQFEFVQEAWLTSAKFAGMSGEQDPLTGDRQPLPEGEPRDGFVVPQLAGPCRRISGLPSFVTVRGGAYFFLPGLKALRFIAQ